MGLRGRTRWWGRSVLAIIAGLFVLSSIAEGVELAVVIAILGAAIQDEAGYFAIRNQTGVLVAKLVYNTVAAVAAGAVTAWIAGRAATRHAVVLATLQLGLFIWGMTASRYAGTTPSWVWLPLVPLMGAGIVLGARMTERRS